MDKKGSIGFIAVILVIILLGLFLVNLASRECNKNADCSDDSYCGSDNECHQYPEQVIVKDSNYIIPSLILGAAIIIAAWIFKRKDGKEKSKAHHDQHHDHDDSH